MWNLHCSEEEQDIGQRDIDSKNGKVFVVPYESVAPASQGNT